MNSFIAASDISHMMLLIALAPQSPVTAPPRLIVSDVSREWPRAPPFPGPGPVTETRNTRTPESGSVRIRTRRSGEYS